MKIAIAANGTDLTAPLSPIFGRCPTYILIDTVSMQFETLANPALSAGGGAGIQSAQFVVGRGAQAVIAGNVGPNAFDVFRAAGVQVYLLKDGTVQQAVEAYKGGRLAPTTNASVPAHVGMRRRR
jgi:predicted Fe-Mo cluster-binding NifX family protein